MRKNNLVPGPEHESLHIINSWQLDNSRPPSMFVEWISERMNVRSYYNQLIKKVCALKTSWIENHTSLREIRDFNEKFCPGKIDISIQPSINKSVNRPNWSRCAIGFTTIEQSPLIHGRYVQDPPVDAWTVDSTEPYTYHVFSYTYTHSYDKI